MIYDMLLKWKILYILYNTDNNFFVLSRNQSNYKYYQLHQNKNEKAK